MYLAPQYIPREISVLTLGNKVTLYCILYILSLSMKSQIRILYRKTTVSRPSPTLGKMHVYNKQQKMKTPHPFNDEVCALRGQGWGRHVRLGHHQVAWFQIPNQDVGLGETQACVDRTVVHLHGEEARIKKCVWLS